MLVIGVINIIRNKYYLIMDGSEISGKSLPLVSVCMLSYNHEKWIGQAIEGVLNQKTNFCFELIISDDCSTDSTQTIINNYTSKEPNLIIPIFNKSNLGLAINFSSALNSCKGRYIAICEGDDFWTSRDKLRKQAAYMEGHPECGMCFHSSEIVGGKGPAMIRPYSESCVSPTEDIIVGGGGFMATNSIMYRKDIMEDPPEFYMSSPIKDFPLQIFTSTKQYAYYIDEVMSAYRVGAEGSWTSRMNAASDRTEKMIRHIKKINAMLKGFDEYSGGKYSTSVKRKIMDNNLEIIKMKLLRMNGRIK